MGDNVALDPRSLRGLAHPLRVRLLNHLREHGPSTATRLGEQLGQSSGATSYHLRQLAAYGFIAEADPPAGRSDEGRPSGRERWWRAAHQGTTLDATASRAAWDSAEGYLRGVAAADSQRVEAALSELPSLPTAWQDVFMMNTQFLRLTADQALDLRTRLEQLVASYAAEPDAPGERVTVQWQLFALPGERGEHR